MWRRVDPGRRGGLAAAGNIIIGFETPLAGVDDAGGNVILPAP